MSATHAQKWLGLDLKVRSGDTFKRITEIISEMTMFSIINTLFVLSISGIEERRHD